MIFRPTFAKRTILDITPELFDEMNVRGVFLDVDNTLTTHDNPVPIDGLAQWLSEMKEHGIVFMIVSNNKPERVSPFAEKIGVDFVADGAKPLSKGFSKAQKKLGIPKSNICAIGDQIFTDILGANLFGIKSVFVYPIEPERSVFFKIKRALEKPLLPKL